MATEKRHYLFIVFNVCFAAFMATLDSYIVNVSLPSIARYFSITISTVSLVVLSYLLSLTSMTLIVGKLADTFGLKKIFTLGYLVFTLGSLLCGLSWTIYLLIASRFIQGIGGAMIIVSGYAIVARYLPGDIRGWAFGYLAVVAALGITVGTPLGGIITGYFSWHWIFLINVPVGIIAAISGYRSLPGEEKAAGAVRRAPFDRRGAFLSFIGILALIFALNYGQEAGWKSPCIIVAFLITVISLALFIREQKRSADPLLDLTILRSRPFVFALLAAVAAIMILSGSNFILPFYLELDRGLQPQQAGLVLMIYSIMCMIVAPLAGRASDRVRPVFLCMAALFSAAAACNVFSLTLHCRGLLPVIVFLAWYGASNALFLSPNNNLVMGLAPEHKQGTASGVFNLVGRLGMVLGVCVFETVFSELVPQGKGGLMGGRLSLDELNQGFQAVYMCASLLCVAGLACSALAARKSPDRSIEEISCSSLRGGAGDLPDAPHERLK
jgi:EmrB/QacA subfamily drug resistance transporter